MRLLCLAALMWLESACGGRTGLDEGPEPQVADAATDALNDREYTTDGAVCGAGEIVCVLSCSTFTYCYVGQTCPPPASCGMGTETPTQACTAAGGRCVVLSQTSCMVVGPMTCGSVPDSGVCCAQ